MTEQREEFDIEAKNQTEAQMAARRHVSKPQHWICYVDEGETNVESGNN
jgi:hypothetical protein